MTYIMPEKVNIRNIKAVYTDFLTYVNNNPHIAIDLDSCQDIDLSLVQLIESARKTAAAGSKSISLTKPANDTIFSTLKRAGLVDAFSPDDAKFWLHKEVH